MDITGIKEKVKSKTFWGAIAGAVACYLTGAVTAPEFITSLFKILIGG